MLLGLHLIPHTDILKINFKIKRALIKLLAPQTQNTIFQIFKHLYLSYLKGLHYLIRKSAMLLSTFINIIKENITKTPFTFLAASFILQIGLQFKRT